MRGKMGAGPGRGNRRRGPAEEREGSQVGVSPIFSGDGARLTRITPRDDSSLDFLRKRVMVAGVVVLIFAALLVFRLWYLQIYQGPMYAEKARENRVRTLDITAPRGNIYDRRGREIVGNRPCFNVVWSRENSAMSPALSRRLARLLEVEESVLMERVRKAGKSPPHVPVRLKEDVDWKTVALIENNRLSLPGVRIEVVPRRRYAYGDLASHVLGYLAEINERELEQARKEAGEDGRPAYQGGDLVGRQGLEKIMEKELRGEKGQDYMEVNSLGFEQRYLQNIEPLPGNDLELTIDVDLQALAEELLAGKAGAAVMMEVNTGRLLVSASSPPMPISRFVGRIPVKLWNEVRGDPLHPLVNKVVQGQYPPGSTFKMVTALAGLAAGVINAETTIYCPGYYHFGNRVYRCWKHAGHGAVNLQRALAESCDVFFYQVGQRLGVDRLAEYARQMGLGERTGVEMEHEAAGLVPTRAWKKRRFGTVWQEGETLSVAIGQGFDLATPLQICLATAVVANGGTVYRPRLIGGIRDPDGHLIQGFRPEVKSRLLGQARNLRLVRRGLVEAVNGRHGTGRRARLEGITVGGKTGTAQVVRLAQYKHLREEEIPYKYRDHAWFTCFAPAENPMVAVTVLVEHGLHGGSAAAPIAGALLRRYFTLEGMYPAGDQEARANRRARP